MVEKSTTKHQEKQYTDCAPESMNSNSTVGAIDPKCLSQFMDFTKSMQQKQNYTDEQLNYLFFLERRMMGKIHNRRRHKRQAMAPRRMECRAMTDEARNALFSAIVMLKQNGNGMVGFPAWCARRINGFFFRLSSKATSSGTLLDLWLVSFNTIAWNALRVTSSGTKVRTIVTEVKVAT